MVPRTWLCSSCRRALSEASRRPRPSKASHIAVASRTYTSITTQHLRATRGYTWNYSSRRDSVNADLWLGKGSPTATQTRAFNSSRRRSAAILNPRKDEDGKDMEVEITPRAAKRLQEIMKKDANPNLCLRVQVESGGCHGFQYLMSLTDMDKISQDEDTVFSIEDGSSGSPAGGGVDGRGFAKVVMDEPSLELLKGSKVDYTMELIGSQFKIVDNPLATSSCGCGTSFDIKA